MRFSSLLVHTTSGALLPLWLCVACTGRAAGRLAAADTLYLGVAVTDGGAPEPYLNGVTLAIERLNAVRQEADHPFAVRLPPDQATVVEAATALRDDPTVIGVVGHAGSAATLEAARVYEGVRGGDRALVAVSPTAPDPAVARASPWVFRVSPSLEDAARALARFASDSLRAVRAAVLYRNDQSGRAFVRVFRRTYQRDGGRIIEQDPYLESVGGHDAYAARIVRRGADLVAAAGGAEDLLTIARALRVAGARAPLLAAHDLGPLTADSALAPDLVGVRWATPFLADRPVTREGAAFVAAYRTRFKTAPDARAALAYDAATLLGLAAREQGPDRRRIRDWLARLGRGVPAHTGLTGPIVFDAWGNPVNRVPQIGAPVR